MKQASMARGWVLCRVAVIVAAFGADRVAWGQLPAPSPTPTRESAATVVVYNKADASSLELANYYASRRAIPPEHVVGLFCPMTEEITRQEYDDMILQPLAKVFTDNGWWHIPMAGAGVPIMDNSIRFIVLMRGIPLKITKTAIDYPGDVTTGMQSALATNAAAVDSELATMGVRTRRITGLLKNPYFESFSPFMDLPLPPFMLVCRLDGPTADDVKRMIDDAMTAERKGLDGFAYIDMRGITSGPLVEGDQWMAASAVELRRYGMPVVWDNSPDLIPEDFPMAHVGVYLGWYSGSAKGPMARDDFRFEPGSVAVHIYSFSASTVRDPHSCWVPSMIAHGVTATIGNVYEPYLGLTPHLDILMDRLRNGMTFAESAYASVPALSWMTTFVGDPLYRPFQKIAFDREERPGVEYDAYKKGARDWFEKGRDVGTKELQASAKQLQSGIVWEGLGLLQWAVPDYEAALASFHEAQDCYGDTDDGVRTVLHQVEILKTEKKLSDGRALAAKGLSRYHGLHGEQLLRGIIGLPSANRP